MNKNYQDALSRLSSIDLDLVLDKFGYELADRVSAYGIHGHPNLEMLGDLTLLKEGIDRLALLEKAFDKACECLDGYQYLYERRNILAFSDKEDWKAFVLEELMEEEQETKN